jgi:hypothetical protein
MDRQEAIAELRELVKPGDTVRTILRHVSQSGMFRTISMVIPFTREDGRPGIRSLDYLAAQAVPGLKVSRRWDGIEQGGAGMDFGFNLVYSLSRALYGDGYPCQLAADGSGRCPASEHVNSRELARVHSTAGHTDGYAVSQNWL